MQPISPNTAKAYDFPVEWGVYVTGVELKSPVGRSNLRPGDITLDEEHTYVNELFAFQPGETVTIEILRGVSAFLIQVTFGETMSG